MITATTTRLMTVSWNIAHGKKLLPRRSTSSLYRLNCSRSSSEVTSSSSRSASRRSREAVLDEALARGARSRPWLVAGRHLDQGGGVMPRRTTRYRCRPMSAMSPPGRSSMCSE